MANQTRKLPRNIPQPVPTEAAHFPTGKVTHLSKLREVKIGIACDTELGPVSIPLLLLNHILLLDDGRTGGLPHFGGYHSGAFLTSSTESYFTKSFYILLTLSDSS